MVHGMLQQRVWQSQTGFHGCGYIMPYGLLFQIGKAVLKSKDSTSEPPLRTLGLFAT